MTIGQRIAQKRKELGLSQEALGDQLGVSRQSIYKWESDSALPEIEKLIALSRLFGMSVGWLLGVEEDTAPERSGELTDSQLKMVEEIVGRYLAAQPKPMSPRRRLLFKAAAAVAAVCLVFALFHLFNRLDRVDAQYNNLQSSVNNVTYSVNSQIGSISNRVEELLKSQNNLTADYSTSIISGDLASNTVTFSFRAIPKTFSEGMVAWLEVQSGSEKVTFGPYEAQDQTFTGQVDVALTNDISLYIVFEADGQRQTQLLDSYYDLYASSLPEVELREGGSFLYLEVEDGRVTLPESYITSGSPSTVSAVNSDLGQADIASVRVGLFRNQSLLQWLEPCDQPGNFHGDYTGMTFFYLPETTVTMTGADSLCFAAVVTDQYGRNAIYSDIPYILQDGALTWPDSYSADQDPAHWSFS